MSTSDVNNSIIESYLKQANLNLCEAKDRVDWWALGEKIEAPTILFRIVRIFSRFKEYFPKQLQDWYLNQVKDVFNNNNITVIERSPATTEQFPINSQPQNVETACSDELLDLLNGSAEKMAQQLAATHPAFNKDVERNKENSDVQIAKLKHFARIYDEIESIDNRSKRVDNRSERVTLAKVFKKDFAEGKWAQFISNNSHGVPRYFTFCTDENSFRLIHHLPKDQAVNVRWVYDSLYSKYIESSSRELSCRQIIRIEGWFPNDDCYEVYYSSGFYKKNKYDMYLENFDLGSDVPFLKDNEATDNSNLSNIRWHNCLLRKHKSVDKEYRNNNFHQRVSETCALDENNLPKNLEDFIGTLRSFPIQYYDWDEDRNYNEDDCPLLFERLREIEYRNLDERVLDLCIKFQNKHPDRIFLPNSEKVKVKIGCLDSVELPRYLVEARSKVFKATLNSGMRESIEGTITIEVAEGDNIEVTESICNQILEYLQTGSYIEKGELITILQIANQYGLKGLLRRCFMTAEHYLSCENVEAILETAIVISYTSLIVGCIDYIQCHREEWENKEIALKDRSPFTDLVDCIALLPRFSFKFLCAPTGGLKLKVSASKLLREHILKALEVVSKHILVQELVFRHGKFNDVKLVLERFPHCYHLDISQLTHTCYQKYIKTEDVLELGCDQITELIVSHPALKKEALDQIFEAFPQIEGFGNTSANLLGRELSLKEYLSYFFLPSGFSEKKKKPKLLALNLEQLGFRNIEGFDKIKGTHKKIIDCIEPYLSHIYYLKIYGNHSVETLDAPKAREIYLAFCNEIKPDMVNAPQAAIWIGRKND